MLKNRLKKVSFIQRQQKYYFALLDGSIVRFDTFRQFAFQFGLIVWFEFNSSVQQFSSIVRFDRQFSSIVRFNNLVRQFGLIVRFDSSVRQFDSIVRFDSSVWPNKAVRQYVSVNFVTFMIQFGRTKKRRMFDRSLAFLARKFDFQFCFCRHHGMRPYAKIQFLLLCLSFVKNDFEKVRFRPSFTYIRKKICVVCENKL